MPFHRIEDPARLQALVGAMLQIGEDVELSDLLTHFVEEATRLAGARFGAIGVLDPSHRRLVEFVTVGADDGLRASIGELPTGKGILGHLIDHPEPLRLVDLRDHPASGGFPTGHPPMRTFLGVPVSIRGEVFGNLYLCDKEDGAEFTQEDEDLVAAFGIAAGLVIDKARLHQRLRELTLVEERERIARNLHDTVIQQLFAAGLRLQGVVGSATRAEVDERVAEVIDDLDETIRQIRTTIFGISPRRADGGRGLRSEILSLTDQVGVRMGLDVRVDLRGPVDTQVDEETAEHLVAALREALSNVVRHAGAVRVEVRVVATDRIVELTVVDDGRGIDPRRAGVGSGLANLRERAKLLHGGCRVEPAPEGGTELVWWAAVGPDGGTGDRGDGR
jgi:signal transduction histidine kinase